MFKMRVLLSSVVPGFGILMASTSAMLPAQGQSVQAKTAAAKHHFISTQRDTLPKESRSWLISLGQGGGTVPLRSTREFKADSAVIGGRDRDGGYVTVTYQWISNRTLCAEGKAISSRTLKTVWNPAGCGTKGSTQGYLGNAAMMPEMRFRNYSFLNGAKVSFESGMGWSEWRVPPPRVNGWYGSEPQIPRRCYVSSLPGLRIAICTGYAASSPAAFLSITNTSRTATVVSVPRVQTWMTKASCGKRLIYPGKNGSCFIRTPLSYGGKTRLRNFSFAHLRVGGMSRTYHGPPWVLQF